MIVSEFYHWRFKFRKWQLDYNTRMQLTIKVGNGQRRWQQQQQQSQH